MPGMVRALGGPVPIAVVVGPRLTIGRAADVDLQIVDPHVSRRHARIERDARGATVLVDLSSACGTFVDDARIQRHVLRDGDVIGIAGVKLRYEEAPPGITQQRPVIERGIRALRPTQRLAPVGDAGARATGPAEAPTVETIVPVAVPAVPRILVPKRVTPAAVRPATTTEVVTMTPVDPTPPRSPAGRPRAAARWTPSSLDADGVQRGATAQLMPAVGEPLPRFPELDDDDTPAAPGVDGRVLVREVFQYRTLRMDAVRGEKLDDVALQRLRSLEDRMHRHSVAERALDHLRRYHRFPCEVPGWLGRRSGSAVSTMAIELQDIGAGGAQVSCPDRRFQVGDPCWLVVDLDSDDDAPLVVFRARVAWSSPEGARMGLAFAGAARSGIDAVELIRAE